MVAEIVHGAPYRFTDPARFSFAHGGKDRHPFPVPLRVYDETIRVLKSAVQRAKLSQDDRLVALKRLDDHARRLERVAAGSDVPALIARERQNSASYGGRSVFGWESSARQVNSGDAIMLPGTSIGDDAPIGAGSAVTRGVPAGATAFGNPARVRKPADGLHSSGSDR
jgi:hypothetical protein